jgi:diacylglycerol O-acyltransferase / wax synthase
VAVGAAEVGEAMTGAGGFRRLSSFDLMFLRLETPEWPCHFGGLTVLEGGALLDDDGRLRMQEIAGRLERRLPLVPQLRRRLHVPGPFGGRPLWVDDPGFAIERHVHHTAVPAPGGDDQLIQAVARVYMRPLDRRHPLWQLWFFTGLDEGRVGDAEAAPLACWWRGWSGTGPR